MKKTFRLFGLIILAVMSIGITACGSDDEEEIGKTVTLTSSNLTEDGYFDGLLYYQVTSNNLKTAIVKKANSAVQIVEIPSRIKINDDLYSIKEIGERAFNECKDLTSVTIPNSVTSIGDNAFYNCSGLTAVHINDLAAWCGISFKNFLANPLLYARHLYLNGTEIKNLVIPNSVTSIGDNAFAGCSGLTSVTIPNSVTSIGWYTFINCSSLTSVTIGNSVTSIGDNAFWGCSGLTSVTIPGSVTSIGDNAFSHCI